MHNKRYAWYKICKIKFFVKYILAINFKMYFLFKLISKLIIIPFGVHL